MYRLSLTRQRHHVLGHARFEYDDSVEGERVWCVTTRAGNIVTRRNGHVAVLGNCEGFDMPSVKCAILARPTKSTGLYLQQAGRILRPWGGLRAVILDHAGCALEHGLPQDDRELTLDSTKRRNKSPSAGPPLKTCAECYAILHAATRVCPECGYVFAPPRDLPEEKGGDLVEITTGISPEKRVAWEKLCATARQLGFKPGWAYHRYVERFGERPPTPHQLMPRRAAGGGAVSRALHSAVRDQQGHVSWADLATLGGDG